MFLEGSNEIEAMNKRKDDKTRKRRSKMRVWFDGHKKPGEPVSISEVAKTFNKQVNTVKAWVDTEEDLQHGNGWIVMADEEIPPQKRRKKVSKPD